MFRRTKRASTAGSITCVVVPLSPPRFRTRLTSRPAAFFGRLSEPRLHVLDGLSLLDAVHQGRVRSGRGGSAARSATSRRGRDRRRRPRAGAPARRPTARAWQRRHDGARSWRSSTPDALARRTRLCRGPRYSPPIKYSYRASTFSSAGTTPSMRWPSSAIRPSARANCSRSRVITSSPRRSSFSLISVM